MKTRLLFLLTISAMLVSCYPGNYHGRTAADESRASAGSMSPTKR